MRPAAQPGGVVGRIGRGRLGRHHLLGLLPEVVVAQPLDVHAGRHDHVAVAVLLHVAAGRVGHDDDGRPGPPHGIRLGRRHHLDARRVQVLVGVGPVVVEVGGVLRPLRRLALGDVGRGRVRRPEAGGRDAQGRPVGEGRPAGKVQPQDPALGGSFFFGRHE